MLTWQRGHLALHATLSDGNYLIMLVRWNQSEHEEIYKLHPLSGELIGSLNLSAGPGHREEMNDFFVHSSAS